MPKFSLASILLAFFGPILLRLTNRLTPMHAPPKIALSPVKLPFCTWARANMRCLITILVAIFLLSGSPHVGLAQEPTVDELISQLKSEDSLQASAAAQALGERGIDSPNALKALVVALEDTRKGEKHAYLIPVGERSVGEFAREALCKIGKPAVPLLAKVVNEGKTPRVRAFALRTFEWLKEDAREASDAITLSLKDEDEWVRRQALHALLAVDPPTPETVAKVVPLISDPDPQVRGETIERLGALGSKASSAAPEIAKRIRDEGTHWTSYAPDVAVGGKVWEVAIASLIKIGPASQIAVPRLREMMHEEEHPKRQAWAAHAVLSIDPYPEPALETLVYLAQDNQFSEQSDAVEYLGNHPEHAEKIVPVLIEQLDSKDEWVQRSAIDAIARIQPSLAQARLESRLANPDPRVRLAIVRALRNYAMPTPQMIELMIGVLYDVDANVRSEACLAFDDYGAMAVPALEKLRNLADADPEVLVRIDAENAITAITGVPWN